MSGEWIEPKARLLVSSIIPGQWDEKQPGILQGRCPGESFHTGASADTDCRIYLSYGPKGESPGCYCLHKSCRHALDEINQKFRDAIFAKNDSVPEWTDPNAGVARKPVNREAWIPDYNEEKLLELIRSVPQISPEWFVERSPVDPRGIKPGEFLEYVFQPGERVIVFTEYKSPGDYIWVVGKGGYRLSHERGTKAVPSKIPTDGGHDGIWYMSQPVDGKWHPNPRRGGVYSRRSAESVTSWRHLVVESDTVAEPLWLRFLAMMPATVIAIYSSGGRSWHTLIRVDAPDKASMDTLLRNSHKRILPIVGADPGALTPVRLTRLPGCTRRGSLQRLIYLNPKADGTKRVRDMPAIRKL